MNLIKGLEINTINQNKIIEKKDFYTCANYEFKKLNYSHSILEETLNSCQKKSISVLDCPVHFLWLGRLIHHTLIPKCGLKYKRDVFFPQVELEFKIIPKALVRIFNKIPAQSSAEPISYPIFQNCTPIVKDFETVKKDVLSIKLLKNAFSFCFPDSIFTALKLFKILKGCVTETLNFLWKNECT
jgi:hypothetical protein